jgi:rhamnosyltransferase subunit B
MIRLLFGNELGAGFGHISRLLAIEDGLRKLAGNATSRFVLKPEDAGKIDSRRGDVFSAPQLNPGLLHPRYPSRFVEHRIVARWLSGEDRLSPLLDFWRKEIDAFKPDLVVIDAAPALALVATNRVPVVMAGNGYTLPPSESAKSIAFRNRRESDGPDSQDDAFWLERIAPILKSFGISALSALTELNRCDLHGVFTLPQFDVFANARRTRYFGPIHPGGSPKPSAEQSDVVLCYFSVVPRVDLLVDGLLQCGKPVLACLPDADGRLQRRLHGTNVKFSSNRFNLAQALPGCGLVVHGASLGMSTAALYAGLPQLGLFQHDEAMMNGWSIHVNGIGAAKPLSACSANDISELIHTVSRSDVMRQNALQLSEQNATLRDSNPADVVAGLALDLLN